VLADQAHARVELAHHLHAQQPEPPVAQHRDEGLALEVELVGGVHRRGEGFCEHRPVVVHRVRDRDEVHNRQAEPLGEAAVAPGDPEHRAVPAMVAEPCAAHIALAAHRVDRTHHPLALEPLGEFLLDRADRVELLHRAHELVPERDRLVISVAVHVAAGDFEVRGADSHPQGTDQRLARPRFRVGRVREHPNGRIARFPGCVSQRLHTGMSALSAGAVRIVRTIPAHLFPGHADWRG